MRGSPSGVSNASPCSSFRPVTHAVPSVPLASVNFTCGALPSGPDTVSISPLSLMIVPVQIVSPSVSLTTPLAAWAAASSSVSMGTGVAVAVGVGVAVGSGVAVAVGVGVWVAVGVGVGVCVGVGVGVAVGIGVGVGVAVGGG